DAVAGSLKISQFFSSTDSLLANNELFNESNNESVVEDEMISEMIKFVNKIIHKKQLLDSKKAHYMA
ncbi:2365_t:CDS:1, partial [Cetraspora pellucida]